MLEDAITKVIDILIIVCVVILVTVLIIKTVKQDSNNADAAYYYYENCTCTRHPDSENRECWDKVKA